jgi:hypothetical protein
MDTLRALASFLSVESRGSKAPASKRARET